MKLFIKGTPIAYFNDRFTVCDENGKEVYRAWGEAGRFTHGMRLFDLNNDVIAQISANFFAGCTVTIEGKTIRVSRGLKITGDGAEWRYRGGEILSSEGTICRVAKDAKGGLHYILEPTDEKDAVLCLCVMFAAHYYKFRVNKSDRYHDYSY